jgi:hypothetical protein
MRDSRTQTNENLSFWLRCAQRFGVRCLGLLFTRILIIIDTAVRVCRHAHYVQPTLEDTKS